MAGAKECGAKTRAGGRCKGKAMTNGRCRIHGGLSPGAPLKHGRRSKFLPKGLKELYEDLVADQELVNLEDDIRTVEADLQLTFRQMQEHAGACWKEARALFETGDHDGLRELFDRGLEAEGLQAKYERLTALKMRLVAVEARRIAMQESNMNARQANALVVALLSAINEEAEGISADARSKIREKLIRLMSPQVD